MTSALDHLLANRKQAMYLPNAFAWTDRPSMLAFCRAHSFATLACANAGNSEAQHIPLLIDDDAEGVVLYGHVATANPLAQAEQAIAIFQGPHAYISATWYGEADTVPTWNYLAVHASGSLRVISDASLIRNLFARLAEADPERHDWQASLSPTVEARLSTAVHWFSISVTSLIGKAKLSQNHPPGRRKRVIDRLRGSQRANDQEIAEAMTRVLSGDTPWPANGTQQ
jgi:transcriptional regulator